MSGVGERVSPRLRSAIAAGRPNTYRLVCRGTQELRVVTSCTESRASPQAHLPYIYVDRMQSYTHTDINLRGRSEPLCGIVAQKTILPDGTSELTSLPGVFNF